MPINDILLPIHDDQGQQARVDCGLAIADATGAVIRCLDIVVPLVTSGDDWGLSARVLAADETNAIVNRQRVEEQIAARGLNHHWFQATGDFSQIMCEEAAKVDLAIVDGESDGVGTRGLHFAAPAMLSRGARAVLAVPHSHPAFCVRGLVAVAWDGSPAAAAALKAALPLLQFSTRVMLVVVAEVDTLDVAEAASLLSSVGRVPEVTWTPVIADV